jgi:hypothetical protein
MAEKRCGDQWRDFVELRNARDDEWGQRGAVYRSGQQHGWKCYQQRGHAHGQSGHVRSFDYYTAGRCDGDGGADSIFLRDRNRHGPAELSMAEKRRGDQWRDCGELCNARDDECGQRGAVYRGGQQHGWKRYQQRGDADGDRGHDSAFDHYAASERDSDGWPDGIFLCDCDRHGAAELSMAEEWRGD